MRKEDVLEVINRFEKSSCTELELIDDRFSLKLRRGVMHASAGLGPQDFSTPGCLCDATGSTGGEPGSTGTGLGQSDGGASIQESGALDQSSMGLHSGPSNLQKDFRKVKAPIVGVFYAAPNPEAEPFVKTGDMVKKGDTLCLMEAMKMMNELKSPVDGVVKAVYGRNGELAEYDEILFEVEEC